jgi:molecular chaperone DnaK
MVELHNQADTAVFAAEKFLRDYGDKLPEDSKKTTRDRIEDVTKAKNSENVDQIRTTTEALTMWMQTLGGQMYEQPGAATGAPGADGAGAGPNAGGPAGNGKASGEDVVDAEFTEA